jgi:hypothetical protein
VCAQSREIVLKVAGSRPSFTIGLDQGISGAGSPYEMICSLKYLANASRDLLVQPTPPVRGRAVLYGLNKAFGDSLEALAEQIRAHEEKINVRPSQLPAQQSMERVRGVLWLLLHHISQVFESAHRVDPTVPEIKTRDAGPRPLGAPHVSDPIVIRVPQKRPEAKSLQIPRVK